MAAKDTLVARVLVERIDPQPAVLDDRSDEIEATVLIPPAGLVEVRVRNEQHEAEDQMLAAWCVIDNARQCHAWPDDILKDNEGVPAIAAPGNGIAPHLNVTVSDCMRLPDSL